MESTTIPAPAASLLRIYGRNIDVACFKRGWSPQTLASRLGISINALNRVRFGRSRYIDPGVLIGLTELFTCEFNELLSRQPGIDYSSD